MSADSIFANMFEGITQAIKELTTSRGTFLFIMRIISIVIVFFFIGRYLLNIVQENTLFTRKHDKKIQKKYK